MVYQLNAQWPPPRKKTFKRAGGVLKGAACMRTVASRWSLPWAGNLRGHRCPPVVICTHSSPSGNSLGLSAHPAQLLEVTGRKTAFDFSKATDVCQLRCNRVSEMFKTTCASKRVCHDSLLFLSRMVHRQSQFGIAAFVTWFTLIQGRERRQKKNHWETEVGTTNHRINEHVGIKKRGVKWRVNCD